MIEAFDRIPDMRLCVLRGRRGLARARLREFVSSGAVVSIYSDAEYVSYALDFIPSAPRLFQRQLQRFRS